MPECKGCGQDIKWIEMVSGKSMPIDPKPQNMVVRVEDLPEGCMPICDPDQGVMIKAYITHWSTCPRSKDFKKGGS